MFETRDAYAEKDQQFRALFMSFPILMISQFLFYQEGITITGPCMADQLNCTLMGVTMAMGPFLGNGGFAL